MKLQDNIIAIDFDGVIHDYKNPVTGKRMGAPIAGAKEAIEKIAANAWIVVFSARATEKGAQHIHDWLNYYQIPYNEVTNVKPNAKIFIDDRGLRFEDWGKTVAFIEDNAIISV